MKVPGDFDRASFWELVVKMHRDCGATVAEAAFVQELHQNALPHQNALVHSMAQGKQSRGP